MEAIGVVTVLHTTNSQRCRADSMNFIIDWIRGVWEQESGPSPAFDKPVAENNRDRSSMADLVRILQAQDAEQALRD